MIRIPTVRYCLARRAETPVRPLPGQAVQANSASDSTRGCARRTVAVSIIALAAIGNCLTCTSATANEIDFARDIQPILAEHCLECHGPQRQEGGLRLDLRAAAEVGGDSMLPILTDDLDNNEIYLRISSDDPGYRMPMLRPPLSAIEIDTIREWLKQGPVWPVDEPAADARKGASKSRSASSANGFWQTAFNELADLGIVIKRHPYHLHIMAAAVLLLGITLASLRLKKRAAAGTPTAGLLKTPLVNLRPSQLLVAAVSLAFFSVGTWQHEVLLRTRRDLREVTRHFQSTNAELQRRTQPSFEELFGDPPVPRRMHHPVALSRTYYRGNDERHPLLYNNGVYRTSTMTLRLVDSAGNTLAAGDAVPNDGLSIEFTFDRAPHATPVLFRPAVIQNVRVTPSYPYVDDDRVKHMDVLEVDRKWGVTYPLPGDVDDGHLHGVLYVWYGAHVSLGIVYDLHSQDGILQPQSDLWMGNLLLLPQLVPPADEKKVAWQEWLDWRPIPVIEEQSVTDPNLLGITPHQKHEQAELD